MQKATIWVTGASGHLGKMIMKKLKTDHNLKVVGTSHDLDVTDIKAVEQAGMLYRPTIIINCASLTGIEACEENSIEAYKVNALGARNVAAVARKQNAKLIYFSTDDVFCGINNRPKNEFDVPTPETVYGKSKLAGENFVRELCPKHLIIRSSWVYGGAKNNYFEKVAQCGREGKPFEAEMDWISSPTSAETVADFVLKVIDSDEYGIMHVSGEGMCSRHQYATEILRLLGYDPALAVPKIGCTDNKVRSTALDNLMLKITGIYQMPQWQDDLKAYAEKYKESHQ